MTVYNDIRQALESQVANVTGIPAAAHRTWENQGPYTPTPGMAWVRSTLMPVDNPPAAIGPNPPLRYSGLFRIEVFWPENVGPASAETLADNIRAVYYVGVGFTKNTTTVRVEYAKRLPGFPDTPWYVVPVDVRWFAYRT